MAAHRLLPDTELELSPVVANNAMNRERGLAGVNSYAKDLGFDPLARLRAHLPGAGSATWLDLCCGAGRALIQAAELHLDELKVTGVDLVDYFAPHRRRRLVTRRGPVRLDLPYSYLGADDTAGPNYTGQPAVDSRYRLARP